MRGMLAQVRTILQSVLVRKKGGDNLFKFKQNKWRTQKDVLYQYLKKEGGLGSKWMGNSLA
jgi:hypothetical protein